MYLEPLVWDFGGGGNLPILDVSQEAKDIPIFGGGVRESGYHELLPPQNTNARRWLLLGEDDERRVLGEG